MNYSTFPEEAEVARQMKDVTPLMDTRFCEIAAVKRTPRPALLMPIGLTILAAQVAFTFIH